VSDRGAEFWEFVAARMESLRGLAYLTCGDWQVAERAEFADPGQPGTWFPANRAVPASALVGGE
jgi:hypothetical protein